MRETDFKKDISNYSEDELSMIVFNDELLYNLRNDRDNLFLALDETFIFTAEQVEVLVADLEDDANEQHLHKHKYIYFLQEDDANEQ
jgi:hypothetical protein